MTIDDPTATIRRRESPGDPVSPISVARWAVTGVFLLNALTLSTYIVRIPSFKAEHHLADGSLGLIGALFAVAALGCMQLVGSLVARVGLRTVLRVALLLMPLLLALTGRVDGTVGFAVVVTVLGAAHGSTDAAMNAYAVAVERRSPRPILNGCHAAWSIGAVLASVFTVAAAAAGVSTVTHLAFAAAVLLVGGLALGRLLPDVDTAGTRDVTSVGGEEGADGEGAGSAQGAARRPGRRRGWSRGLVALGLTGVVLMMSEAAVLGWGPVLLHDNRGASLGMAAAGVTAYTLGQTAGRLMGDRLTARLGGATVFRSFGLTATTGFALAVLTHQPLVAVGAFAVAGVGSSVLIPLTFSAVGRLDGDAAVIVPRFTTCTYAGILLGPALIGWTAQLVGLPRTLAALIPLMAAVAVLAPGQRAAR